jgi:hypothetical protein
VLPRVSLNTPTQTQTQEGGETTTHSIQVADRLCKVLRPHQREGVQFVFECGAWPWS